MVVVDGEEQIIGVFSNWCFRGDYVGLFLWCFWRYCMLFFLILMFSKRLSGLFFWCFGRLCPSSSYTDVLEPWVFSKHCCFGRDYQFSLLTFGRDYMDIFLLVFGRRLCGEFFWYCVLKGSMSCLLLILMFWKIYAAFFSYWHFERDYAIFSYWYSGRHYMLSSHCILACKLWPI